MEHVLKSISQEQIEKAFSKSLKEIFPDKKLKNYTLKTDFECSILETKVDGEDRMIMKLIIVTNRKEVSLTNP